MSEPEEDPFQARDRRWMLTTLGGLLVIAACAVFVWLLAEN